MLNGSTMRYQGTVYRPPSEAQSLILQATLGCSYNRCSYCAMYLDKRFRPRPAEELTEDIAMAQAYHGAENVRRVFLADGDALILRTSRLLEILDELRAAFPNLERASVYASPQAMLKKSVEDIRALKAAGLPLYYTGPETGDAVVMERIAKGVTPDEFIEGSRRIVDAGAKLSAILLLGIGGVELSEQHAHGSAELINAIEPRYVSTLTLTPVPGTPIHAEIERGELVLPDEQGILTELRTMLAGFDLPRGAVFRSNHASNQLPLGGTLNKDRDALLATLDHVIETPSFPLRPKIDPRFL